MVEIRPHIWQQKMMQDVERFKVACWGRRSGKTTSARYKIMHKAFCEAPAKIWFVALTYGQAKTLMWDYLVGPDITKRLIDPRLVAEANKSELYIRLINGSQIWLKGGNALDNVLGESLDLLIIDEYQSQDEEIFGLLRPMLSDRSGESWLIGTPRGHNHFYRMFQKGNPLSKHFTEDWKAYQITTLMAAIAGTGLDPKEITDARRDMSKTHFEQEYEASFEAMVGLVYDAFDDELNVREYFWDANRDQALDSHPLLVGMDFNVSPMTATLAVMPDAQHLFIQSEIYENNSNTERVAQKIRKIADGRADTRVFVYPDASGKNRNTASTNTNFAILESYGFKIMADNSNPRVEDRVNEVNALLENANGDRRLIINPSCERLIESLKSHAYDDRGVPDKKSGFDHITDALGYLVHQEFPITQRGGGHITQIW